MQTVTIHDAKTHLSKYVAKAKAGEKVYIGSFGKPEVVLTKLDPIVLVGGQKRDFSWAKGKVRIKRGAFSVKTDELVAKMMYGDL